MTHTFHKRQIEEFNLTFRHFFNILLTVLLTSCFRRDTDLLRYLVIMRVFGGNERALLEKTGTQTARKHPERQNKQCSVRFIYCHNCFNFSTAIQAVLIYSIVKQQNVKLRVTSKCKVCHPEIFGFFPPGQPKNRENSTKKLGTRLH